MKICWDNIENIRLTRNGYFRKGTDTYVYEEACSECGEPFLKQKRRNTCFCSLECLSKSNRYRALKSKLQKGKTSSFKGKRHTKKTKYLMSLSKLGKKHSEETKQKISLKNKGSKKPNGFGKKISEARKGKKFSVEHMNNLSGPRPGMQGNNHPNWKGGVSKLPYCTNWTKNYRDEIKERDNFLCQNPYCYKKTNILVVHHIDYTKTLCGPDNLITVCNSCNSKANYDREWHKNWYRVILSNKYIYFYEE